MDGQPAGSKCTIEAQSQFCDPMNMADCLRCQTGLDCTNNVCTPRQAQLGEKCEYSTARTAVLCVSGLVCVITAHSPATGSFGTCQAASGVTQTSDATSATLVIGGGSPNSTGTKYPITTSSVAAQQSTVTQKQGSFAASLDVEGLAIIITLFLAF
ncbi:hypothetical protein BCR33DRAFT_761695 [Rhizoclosmatium globosum]|uniref:Uncharacterized protein n=1 Tax=Rhizoclosmatium globosum TaxID=329046 RepID=A0A1Y2D093_9FUNG|nr:hypothetical protein BCR33DRAFT_761695 [Rhizoclosmatium globosum]|eukprot:ORY52534.1 hypothetical protein BCR33DRAFT_761695 [Rhizoclosmatium globosum]